MNFRQVSTTTPAGAPLTCRLPRSGAGGRGFSARFRPTPPSRNAPKVRRAEALAYTTGAIRGKAAPAASERRPSFSAFFLGEQEKGLAEGMGRAGRACAPVGSASATPLKGGVMRGVEQEKGHKQKSSFLCPHAHRPCTDCTRSTGAGVFHRAKFKILKTSPPASRTVPDARRSSGKPLPSLQTARSASPDLPRSPASPGATRKPPA